MCLEMSHIFQCAPNIYQNLLQMCIPRLSFMFHVYNSTWKKVNIMLRLPEIGSHAAYQQILSQHISNKRFKRFKKKMRKLATKLQSLDLSPVDDIMRPFLLRGSPSRMAAFLYAAFLPPFHMAQINFTRWLGRTPSHRWMRCSTVWLHSWTYTNLCFFLRLFPPLVAGI